MSIERHYQSRAAVRRSGFLMALSHARMDRGRLLLDRHPAGGKNAQVLVQRVGQLDVTEIQTRSWETHERVSVRH